MTILSIFFFITAILYSSVGFGGGSTYLALMIILDVPYYIFPIIALICNIIVVSGNSVNYIRSGNLNLRLLLPYLAGSIPFAFFGASILIEKEFFELLLFFVLLIAGVFLLIESKSFNSENFQIKKVPIFLSVIIGSILGFISGIVGIGGGIFLSPILYLLKSGYPKQIATTASLFILINSLFGIAGQLTKDRTYYEFLDYWPLFVVVLIGGLIGNILNLKFFSNKTLVIITAVLVIFVSVRMGFKLFS
ncbi:MAG: hypothetical protein CNC05_00770 [Pelagibacterales bacterium MED-G42]|jgi:uncharacterized membrane protein YfcA|nr:MAG: hypothetical protein CNC05_00770 [Pelagibacterales bacterium MED-G42]|tara:strand:+ start:1831 stop:2577 length:747 start_codon:yes stop_codon:yes gene_type:complete